MSTLRPARTKGYECSEFIRDFRFSTPFNPVRLGRATVREKGSCEGIPGFRRVGSSSSPNGGT